MRFWTWFVTLDSKNLKTKLIAYTGCFTDENTPNRRQLTDLNSTSVSCITNSTIKSWFGDKCFIRDPSMTIDLCYSICKECNFKYMGVNFG